MNDYVYFKNEFVRLLDRLRLNNGLWEEGMIDDHLYQENIRKIEEDGKKLLGHQYKPYNRVSNKK